MTAEIAVMNKHGVALAADSAVTVRSGRGPVPQGPKIRATANKIFTLSKYEPVGVMIYDSAEIMGVPWEPVIKAYREELGTTHFPTLEGYVHDFVRFLGESRQFFPPDLQDLSVQAYVDVYYRRHFLGPLTEQVQQRFDVGEELDEDQIREMFEAIIQTVHSRWSNSARLPGIPDDREEELQNAYGAHIERALSRAFKQLPAVKDETAAQLREVPIMIYTRIPPGFFTGNFQGATGIVFAGYGTDEVFPSFREIFVDEVIHDHLVWWPHREAAIDREHPGCVCAFAQEEEARTFMEGVDPRYEAFVEASLDEIMEGFTKEIFKLLPKNQPSRANRRQIESARRTLLDSYKENLAEERERRFTVPVIESVQSLSLTDMAEMADSLVNLTSLKRKVSMDEETVSGPIDVAVISKGDGFIWINRKHYFSADKNPHFLANYYREG